MFVKCTLLPRCSFSRMPYGALEILRELKPMPNRKPLDLICPNEEQIILSKYKEYLGSSDLWEGLELLQRAALPETPPLSDREFVELGKKSGVSGDILMSTILSNIIDNGLMTNVAQCPVPVGTFLYNHSLTFSQIWSNWDKLRVSPLMPKQWNTTVCLWG